MADPQGDTAAAEAAARIAAAHGDDPAALIEMLHDLQEDLGRIPEAAERTLADRLNLSRAEVHGVVSFYHDFRKQPAGHVVVKLCAAEACQSMGGAALISAICRSVGAALGETAASGVTLEPVYCLGACACAPAAEVNGRLHARLTVEKLEAAIGAAAS
jgi:formate dehydrogenase subunit gamma